MSDDPGHVEMAGETQLERGTPQPRVSGKGPFILAKVIVSYLQKKKEVNHAHPCLQPIKLYSPYVCYVVLT